MITLKDVIQLVADVLLLEDQIKNYDENTQLLGSIPEFDSMAVVSVITAVEENFGLIIDDDDITADIFETFGTLHKFLEGL
jgi:acyl carrier protein